MYYRTRTYLAGDWDGDSDLIGKIQEWNNSDRWALDFSDAHDLTQARDGSLNCSIKRSLSERLNASKKFVLIVGKCTNTVRSGGCQFCRNYNPVYESCRSGMRTDTRSYVKYECEKAYSDFLDGEMDVVVIYNSTSVNRDRCPDALRWCGTHIAGRCKDVYGRENWNYQEIKAKIMA